MHSVVETSIFSRRADALLEPSDRAELISVLASEPDAGAVIPGLQGVRKLRFAPKGRGKSGAFRVIYFYQGREDQGVFALLIYGKNEQVDLTSDQRAAILKLVQLLK